MRYYPDANIIVTVELTESNYAAYVEKLPGCVSAGKTFEELKNNIREAIEGHLEVCREFGDTVPDEFSGEYELGYHFDSESLLRHYNGIFTHAALERLTNINQRQLQRYATGISKPKNEQARKIENALHLLGKELLAVEL
jgi:predicted RNase H-like HicB family nuclease